MASQVDDPVVSQSPLIPSLHTEAEKYCITCGKSNSVDLCLRCKGVWYCNKECEKADSPCHQLLCSKYAKVNEIEPLEGGYRAFLFRSDSLKPDIVILPTSTNVSQDFKSVLNLLRKPGDKVAESSVERVNCGFNSRLKGDSSGADGIQVIARADHVSKGSEPNKSLFTAVRATGAACPPYTWAGNIVVQRVKSGTLEPMSTTMADFRHALDWFAKYPQHCLWGRVQEPVIPPGIDEFWTFKELRGVLICGDQLIKDESQRYCMAWVDGNDRLRGLKTEVEGDISPISERIGRPIRIETWRSMEDGPNNERHPDADGPCSPVVALMRSLDTNVRDPSCSPQVTFGLSKGTTYQRRYPRISKAYVVSADDTDLSINDVKAMVHFSEITCREVFQNVTLTPPENKDCLHNAMKLALDFMTWDNYLLAFDELGLPRPQRPTQEAFIDMRGRSSPPEYFNIGQETDEEEDGDNDVDEDSGETADDSDQDTGESMDEGDD